MNAIIPLNVHAKYIVLCIKSYCVEQMNLTRGMMYFVVINWKK